MSDQLQQAVNQILERTGIGRQLRDEAEAQRAARFEALRKRKAEALAKYAKDSPKAAALVEAAEAKQRAAQKAAEDALQEYIRAREVQSNVIGTLQSVVDPIDAEMRQCHDPAISELERDLEAQRADIPNLLHTVADPDGPLVTAQGHRFRSNQAAVDRRHRAILAVQDECKRLRIHPDVTDVAGEIARLRKSIPEA